MGDPHPQEAEIDMEQIRFKTGEKQHFISTRNFTLGNTGASVSKGMDLFFDGSVVEVGGTEYSYPQFRGAIKVGWAVPANIYDEDNAEYGRPVAAGIQVRHPTQGGNPMTGGTRALSPMSAATEADERVVGNAKDHAAQTKGANSGYQRGAPVNPRVTGMVEAQDGVPVRTLKTAAGERAKAQRTVLTAESVGSALRQANASGVIDPGQGISEEEMLSRMPEEDQEQYLAKKEAHKSKYVDEPPQARTTVRQVKTAKSGESEGMAFKNDVGHGIEIADMGGMGGKAKESTVTEDGITFKLTNGPTKLKPQAHPRSEEAAAQKTAAVHAVVNGTLDVRRKIAKAMCPDFPDNYLFDLPAKKKLARLQADYEDRSDVLQAVFAAESDDFKNLLVQEFPHAFEG